MATSDLVLPPGVEDAKVISETIPIVVNLESFLPAGDRILIEPYQQATTTAAGLHIPDSVQNVEVLRYGLIVKVGPDTEAYDIGDSVAHHKNTGTPVRIQGQDYLILRENDVWGTVEV